MDRVKWLRNMAEQDYVTTLQRNLFLATADEIERLRSAVSEADAATGDLWMALRRLKEGEWDEMKECIGTAFKRLNEYVDLAHVAGRKT
jgi:hypothetical protein